MRTIDGDALINTLQELFDKREKEARFTGNRGVTVTWNDAIYHIKTAPTIETEQRWIPVSEGLPEGTAIVTVETKTFKHKYVCEAVWIPRWTWKAEYDNWEDCSEYNEDEDEYYVLEGWYERVHNWDEYSYVGIEDDVIAWMPLPEPYGGDK